MPRGHGGGRSTCAGHQQGTRSLGSSGAPAPGSSGREGGGTEIRYRKRRESSGVIALWRSGGGLGG